MIYNHDDTPDVGPCCACGQSGPSVRNFLMLHRLAPVPGTGWGCLVCDLPQNGAMAVVCDACLVDGVPDRSTLKWVIKGLPVEKVRVSIKMLSEEEFEHDYTKHREEIQEWN